MQTIRHLGLIGQESMCCFSSDCALTATHLQICSLDIKQGDNITCSCASVPAWHCCLTHAQLAHERHTGYLLEGLRCEYLFSVACEASVQSTLIGVCTVVVVSVVSF